MNSEDLFYSAVWNHLRYHCIPNDFDIVIWDGELWFWSVTKTIMTDFEVVMAVSLHVSEGRNSRQHKLPVSIHTYTCDITVLRKLQNMCKHVVVMAVISSHGHTTLLYSICIHTYIHTYTCMHTYAYIHVYISVQWRLQYHRGGQGLDTSLSALIYYPWQWPWPGPWPWPWQ
jgi:hypothetical protein